jgi:NADPH-dependent curcumin reductase CurA
MGYECTAARWKVKYREDVVDGLAKAPEAIMGRNLGMLLVRVSDAVE